MTISTMFRRPIFNLTPLTQRARFTVLALMPLQVGVQSSPLAAAQIGASPGVPKSKTGQPPKVAPHPAPKPTKTAALLPEAAPKVKPVATPARPVATPIPVTTPVPVLPQVAPLAQAYAVANPLAQSSQGQTMVPIQFLANAMGASAGPLGDGTWRVVYFDHIVDLAPNQAQARFDDNIVNLTPYPRLINGTFYVPLQPFAELLDFQWKIVKPANTAGPKPWTTTFLLTYPAAFIENVSTKVLPDKVQTTITLDKPTRIVAAQNGLDVNMSLAAARRPSVSPVQEVKDYLVPRTKISSGNWRANFAMRINYTAPVQWYTAGSPARIVIEVQRLFEETNSNPIGGGIAFTKIRKGTGHGPVQMFLARVDPTDGWRVRVAPAGYSVLQRARPSQLASRHKALVAINGGFFAYDGAAVGAMLVGGEWIRLPWAARTAIGFRPDGTAQIGNLQTISQVEFSGPGGPEFRLPVRELNGWPDANRVTALTSRFGNSYNLKTGEMALVVKNGVVVARPGGGYAAIYPGGFTLVASGGARPYLEKVQRGQKVKLKISAPGWDGITTALGGGPRLVRDGQVDVTDIKEKFRSDVRVGLGPRTAMGIDKDGRYIILVVDGRQGYYSTGLTLTELAYTMQKLGAVDAINMDGGGSTAMVVRNQLVNRPSDGIERSVANVLMVMR